MRIADLRYRITILEISNSTKTELGGRQRTFTDKFSCFAGVNIESGEEEDTEDRFVRNLTATFKIRYRNDVKRHNRIRWDGKVFKINNLYPNARKTRLIIEGEEVVE